MNPKNTLTLALTLGLLTLGLYLVRSRSGGTETPVPEPSRGGAVTSRELIEDPPGEVVKISLKRPGRDEWLFEKKAEDHGHEVWYMTSPREFKAVSWEVEKLPRQLGSLMYDISYEKGESGAVSADAAGLAPPHAVVTMSDKDGKSTTVEIGGPAGKRETYVRLAGSPRICVGKSSLSSLFKDKAVNYREKMLWSFDEHDATRIEIVDREAGETQYVFTRHGARWMVESPVAAKATSKVQEAVAALARLRVIQWHDDDESKLPIYGLTPAAFTFRVTVEQTVEVKSKDSDDASEENKEEPPAPPKTETNTSVYVLHVSDRSPIGEETKVYVRAGDDPAVATIMKTTLDQIKPVLSEWRDRRLTSVDVTTATSFELTTPHGSLSAKRENGSWRRADGSAALDEQAVSDLLKGIHDLSATAYAKNVERPAGAFGFDHPQASISLMVPGATAPERIVIGTFTDATSKRLLFARHNDEVAIAKVRVSDVATLIQDPIAYVDHTVFHLAPSAIVGLTVESANPVTQGRQTLRYEKKDGVWSMTAPIPMEVNQEALGKLATTLAGLRATRVLASPPHDADAGGLQEPATVVTITYDQTMGSATGDHAIEVTSLTLRANHGGQVYAKRQDAATFYELDGSLVDMLVRENTDEHLWSFEPDSISSFSVESPQGAFSFDRREGRWVYAAEPDLPLDNKKVEGLLLRIRDLRVARIVDYAADRLAAYGLDRPAFSLSLTDTDNTTWQLAVAKSDNYEGKVFAHRGDAPIVVLLEDNAPDRFSVALDSLERRDP